MPSQLLFFFSALGAFNGVLAGSWLLLFAKPRSLSNRLLGACLLMLSLRVGKSVFLFFNPDLARSYLQLGLTACFFIGPFLYLYVRSVYRRASTTLLLLHLVPLTLIALVVGILVPYEQFPERWNPYIVRGIYVTWAGYALAALWELREPLLAWLRPKSSTFTVTAFHRWLLTLVASNLVLVGLYLSVGFVSYLSGACAFTLLLYAAWSQVSLRRLQLSPKPDAPKATPSVRQELAPHLVQRLQDQLNLAMETEERYVDADLRLADLAQVCGVTTHVLSKFLNEHLGLSFTHYVNGYRIERAKALLVDYNHLTLEAIGLACGFNSRSTFYAAFKRATGTTPAQYKRTLS